MIYVAILAALLLVGSIARIFSLNSEIKTLEKTGDGLQARIASWESENPIDFTSPDTYAETKARMPKELQEAEVEFEWFSNERDSKKESRTIWFGAAALLLIATVIAFGVVISNSK